MPTCFASPSTAPPASDPLLVLGSAPWTRALSGPSADLSPALPRSASRSRSCATDGHLSRTTLSGLVAQRSSAGSAGGLDLSRQDSSGCPGLVSEICRTRLPRNQPRLE